MTLKNDLLKAIKQAVAEELEPSHHHSNDCDTCRMLWDRMAEKVKVEAEKAGAK